MDPDLSILRGHGTDGEFIDWKRGHSLLINEPFCLIFSKGNKNLYYVGTIHTNDTNSPTFKLIHKIIMRYNPHILLLEGLLHNKGINPDVNLTGEGGYAMQLAQRKNIKYLGVEMDESDLIKSLAKKHGVDNVCGYCFLRMHKYCYKTLHTSKEDFLAAFESEKIFLSHLFNVSVNPEVWYKQTFDKEFKYGKHIEYSSPYEGDDAVITQQIAADHSAARDANNIQYVYDAINTYNSVMLIMGQNHIYADLRVLQKSFGKKCKLIRLGKKV